MESHREHHPVTTCDALHLTRRGDACRSSRDARGRAVITEIDLERDGLRPGVAPDVDLARGVDPERDPADEPGEEVRAGRDLVGTLRAELANVDLVIADDPEEEVRGPLVVLFAALRGVVSEVVRVPAAGEHAQSDHQGQESRRHHPRGYRNSLHVERGPDRHEAAPERLHGRGTVPIADALHGLRRQARGLVHDDLRHVPVWIHQDLGVTPHRLRASDAARREVDVFEHHTRSDRIVRAGSSAALGATSRAGRAGGGALGGTLTWTWLM